jgi:hypothetical protein
MGNYLYVDKTEFIVKLLKNERRVFVARPRRFGKSLMISALKNLYLGNTDLFKGLSIENHLKEPLFQPHPVICLDMSKITLENGVSAFNHHLSYILGRIAEDYNVNIYTEFSSAVFEDLIVRTSKNHGKPVILIDEYDAPLIKTYDNPSYQDEIRKCLREFYQQIKSCDECIHVACITGISKFSNVGVFSATNNIVDFSMKPGFCTMFGYTDEEIKKYFSCYLPSVAEALEIDEDSILPRLKAYYDGYTFCGESTVYNPVSVLSFFKDKKFKSYWINTGEQEFIAKYMSSKVVNVEDFDNLNPKSEISEDQIERPGEVTEELKPALYLYQAGYLTPKMDDELGVYYLTYPNIEVRISMLKLVKYNFFDSEEEMILTTNELRKALKSGNYAEMLAILNRLFSATRSKRFTDLTPKDSDANSQDDSKYEVVYQNILAIFFLMGNFKPDIEEPGNKGLADIVFNYANKTFVIEIKVSKTRTTDDIKNKLNEAVTQIINNNYLGPYKNPVPVSLAIDSKCRRIALAAVAGDVYRFVPREHDETPARFVKDDTLKYLLKPKKESE